jgi:hypothetical protein
LFDLVPDLVADIVDAVGQTQRRDMRLVDLVEILDRECAVAAEKIVDLAIELRMIAGCVGVPDLVVARVGRVAQRPDLTERYLRERKRPLVLVTMSDH